MLKNLRSFIFVVTYLFFSGLTFCKFEQNNKFINSTKNAIETPVHDSITINKLRHQSFIFEQGDPIAYMQVNQKIQSLCSQNLNGRNINETEKKFFLTQLSKSLFAKGKYYFRKGELDSSLKSLNKSLKIAQETDHKIGQGICLNYITRVYNSKGDTEQELKYTFKSIEKFEELDDKKGRAFGYYQIGNLYLKSEKQKKALKYFSKSLKLFEEINDTIGRISQLNNIAISHYKMQNKIKSIEYYKKSLVLSEKLKEKDRIATSLVNIALTYFIEPANYDSVLVYSYKSLKLFQELNNEEGKIVCLRSIGKALFQKKQLELAEKYVFKSFELAQKTNFYVQIPESALLLSLIYESQNKTKASLEMHKLYVAIMDSIDKNQINTILTKQQAKYKSKKEKEKINDLVNEKKAQKKQFYFWSAVFGSILFLIGSCLFILHNVKINNYKKELNSLRELKKEHTSNESSPSTTSIQVTRGKKIMLIDLNNIAFFHAANRFIFLTNTKGESYIIDYTLKKLEETLPNYFLRVHNSYLVNKNEIQEITKTYNKKVIFIMKNIASTKIPSSVKYTSNVDLILKTLT